MRRGVFLILINAMILLVVFALMLQATLIVQRIAQADSLEGKVEVRRGGEDTWQTLGAGDFIKTRDTVRTGSDGSALFRWADGTRWKLLPDSQLTVKKASFNTLKKTEESRLTLESGKVFVRIVKTLKPDSRFEIATPTAVAVVRGTIFSVAVANGQTEVNVYKGSVQVTKPNADDTAATVVQAGETAIADAPGAIRGTRRDTSAAFLSQPAVLQPQLTATVQPLAKGTKALIKGRAEVGSVVFINGDAVAVLGNGSFFKRVSLRPGTNTFIITSRDRHEQETTLTKTIDAA